MRAGDRSEQSKRHDRASIPKMGFRLEQSSWRFPQTHCGVDHGASQKSVSRWGDSLTSWPGQRTVVYGVDLARAGKGSGQRTEEPSDMEKGPLGERLLITWSSSRSNGHSWEEPRGGTLEAQLSQQNACN